MGLEHDGCSSRARASGTRPVAPYALECELDATLYRLAIGVDRCFFAPLKLLRQPTLWRGMDSN